MKTQEFLIFKDRLIEYLRSFVKSLQINASAIEQYLKNTEEHQIIAILEKEAKYEVSIPQIDVELTKEMILDLPEGERGITEEETETKEQQIKNTMLAQMDSKLDLILAYQEAALE